MLSKKIILPLEKSDNESQQTLNFEVRKLVEVKVKLKSNYKTSELYVQSPD